MKLRWYQEEAKRAIYDCVKNSLANPCVCLPTGAGKTPLLASVCADMHKWGRRVLVVAHVKELLEQAAEKLTALLPLGAVGLYSAGLKRRDRDAAVMVAGIQSIHRKGLALAANKAFDLLIVDEAHLVPASDGGMYRRLIADLRMANPKMRAVGLTATPWRLDSGLIYGGDDTIFDRLAYEANVQELIGQGWLSPLKSRAGKRAADMAGVHVRGGEFVQGEMASAFQLITESAVAEILQKAEGRRSGLLFCSGVEHARAVAAELRRAGEGCGVVTGETPAEERARLLSDFKAGRLRWLANCNVLTTGFDAPNVDCIALLRATLSPGLYCQMVGRGLRVCEGKQDCLVLDYGENVARHGPIDRVRAPRGKGQGASAAAAMKACPECGEMVFAGFRTCPECGAAFPEPEPGEKLTATASEEAILSEPETVEVTAVDYALHVKRGHEDDPDTPPTMRVTYHYSRGMWEKQVSEWVCVEHHGYARQKAERWWRERTPLLCPDTVAKAVAFAKAGVLASPGRIKFVEKDASGFPRILEYLDMSDVLDPEAVDARLAMADVDGEEAFCEQLLPRREKPEGWWDAVGEEAAVPF